MESDRNLQATGKDSLSDAQRVKVLSPSMLVFKRFVRNKLAITGLIILVIMFSFSFIGGIVSPYSQSQVFKKYEYTSKEFAGATVNREIRYVVADGMRFDSGTYAAFVKALNKGEDTFSSDGVDYSFDVLGDGLAYQVMELQEIASVTGKKNLYRFTQTGDVAVTDEMQAAYASARKAGESGFEVGGTPYRILVRGSVDSVICVNAEAAILSANIFDAFSAQDVTAINSYAFHAAAERAIAAGAASFELDGASYAVENGEGSVLIYRDGAKYAGVSDLIVNAISPDVFITVEFKEALQKAIDDGAREFTIADEAGNETLYTFTFVAAQYTISTQALTLLNDTYAAPSAEHLLGTDNNGMDVMTRLMYGGRVSLLVGFVVVFIEMFIGIIFGGVSGYFGGWIDTALMRFVDLFNCIPFWPILIILGSVLDTLDIKSTPRIFILMLILGLLSWTGIARVVRGQILSLREQDFMVATEATGIRVTRRIFRHLVPNVMPLLIVQATMSLGGIIITEATLSFLGLGIKYPMASWGSIINAATDIYVMKAYLFIWIPAGILILLTVLGFNFVGDGLRDAFDPKMKR